MTFPPRVFSGIQPTGVPHLGNYLGALAHWVSMQEQDECLFGIMDLHAITVPQDPTKLREGIRKTAASLLGIGIDPERSILFAQSSVPAHTELAWIFGCLTPLGWLNRMTQFKEKAGKQKENASLGLYGYPVLQTADILLYKATHVPVGEDQKQHLELSRDIAGAFNRAYGEGFFPLPEPMILGPSARVMSLRDGTRKMSKSDPSDFARIDLTDSNETIDQKIRKAKSDAIEGMSYDPASRPEAANYLGIYASITGQTTERVAEECANYNFSAFKARLSEALIAHLSPIRDRIALYLNDPAQLDTVLKNGAVKAQAIADETIREVREKVGFLPFAAR